MYESVQGIRDVFFVVLAPRALPLALCCLTKFKPRRKTGFAFGLRRPGGDAKWTRRAGMRLCGGEDAHFLEAISFTLFFHSGLSPWGVCAALF